MASVLLVYILVCYSNSTVLVGTSTISYDPNKLSSKFRRSSLASRAGRAILGFSVPILSWTFRAMLGRIARKGAGTVDGGVPSSVVSSARIECEDSTLVGVPAMRYVLESA
jgi:hypothetical protein